MQVKFKAHLLYKSYEILNIIEHQTKNFHQVQLLTIMLWLIRPLQNDALSSKMNETLANGYPSESTQRELSNEYQHNRVSKMVFKFGLKVKIELTCHTGKVD